MIKCVKLCVLVLGCVCVFGCAGQKNGSVTAQREASYRPDVETALLENDPSLSGQLVKKAKSAIGTPYVLGGGRPGGFDCSGLVKWAYDSVGVELPRTAREQSVVGTKVKDVKDMRAGDIVAFRHPRRGYHTGIYVGNGKFVHSPRERSSVRINSISDSYFSKTLLGARRVSLDGSENLVAQAEERLRGLVAEKSRLALSARNLEKISKASKNATAASRRGTAKTVAAKSSKSAVKSAVAKSAKNAKATRNTAKTAKSAKATRNTAKTAKSASRPTSRKAPVAQGKTVKTGKSARVASAAPKKNAHKTVSMLQQKKTSMRGRNHS